MFTWAEVGMFFAGFLFGCFYWRREIMNGVWFNKMAKQKMRDQEAYVENIMGKGIL